MKRKRQSIRWLMFKMDPLGFLFKPIGAHIRHLLCRVFGHKKPYTQRFSGQTCPRCNLVMKEGSKYKYIGPL